MQRHRLALVLLLLVAAPASAAPPIGERCRAAKLHATGAHALALLRCHASAIGKAAPVKAACLAAADAKLARAFSRAESKADCPPALAAAQAQSQAFVAALIASAQPTPVPTATPAPTATPSSTGCGNGVVEGTEQCDGQPYCAGDCSLRSPTVCCGPVGACIQGPFPDLADMCGGMGIPYSIGAVCEPTDPQCDPTAGCAGLCRPEATFSPTAVCCEMSPGCAQQTVDDTIELWAYFFQQCLLASGTGVRVGTCGPAGDCVPGS